MEEKKLKKQRQLLSRLSLFGLAVFGGGLAWVLTATKPESVGLLGIIGFFVLVFGAVFSFFLLFLGLRQNRGGIKFRSILRTAVLALGLVMLLAMSSTSTINPLDVGLVVLFEVAALFYIGRTT